MHKVRTRVWSAVLSVAMLLSLLPVSALAADGAEEATPPAEESGRTIDFGDFLEEVAAAGYNYDGQGVTVQWSPSSACTNNLANHTCLFEDGSASHPADGNNAQRIQAPNAQYQIFGGQTDVSISNVHFVFVPANYTLCMNSTWGGTATAEETPNAELQMQNTGDVTFKSCTFDKVIASPFSSTTSTVFEKCEFSNVYNAYAIKDIHSADTLVTDCTFTNCGGGIYLEGTTPKNKITITENTFSGVDNYSAEGKEFTRGLIQFSAAGDYGSAAITISGNQSDNKAAVLRQLNYTLDREEVAAVITAGGNQYGGELFTDDSTETNDQLPGEASFPKDMTVYDGETYYETMTAALAGIHETGKDTLWCKPGADLGTMTHGHVCADLTVYGNGAYLSAGERDFEVDTYAAPGGQTGSDLTGDVTLKVYNLTGAGAWGERSSEYTVNLWFEGCQNMERVYFSGTEGINNITLKNCTFDGRATDDEGEARPDYLQAGSCAIFSNPSGTITVEDCTFTGVQECVNLNHEAASGTQTITVEGCTFTDCSTTDICTSDVTWAAPIRLVSKNGGESSATVKDCTFTYSEGKTSCNGDILLGDGREGKTSYPVYVTLTNTAAQVQVQQPGQRTATENNGTTMKVEASATPATLSNTVATIGTEGYTTLAAALENAAPGAVIELNQDVTEKITIDKAVTINGNGHTITGADANVAVTVTVPGVTLNNLNVTGVGSRGLALVVGAEGAPIDGNVTINGGTYTTSLDTPGLQGEGAIRVFATGKVTVKDAATVGGIHLFNPGSYEITGNTIGFTYTGDAALVGILLKTDAEVDASALAANNAIGVPNAKSFYVKVEPVNSWESTDEVPATNAVATIGDNRYATLQDALDAVADGGTITLLANNGETVTVDRAVTFTLSGGVEKYTYTGLMQVGAGYSLSYDEATGTYTVTERQTTTGGSATTPSYSIKVEKAENGTVSTKSSSASGMTVTVTVKADKGYELDKLTVTDKNDKELKLTDKGDGKYSFTMPASSVTVTATFKVEGTEGEGETATLPFTDVESGDWFYDAVVYVWENKMVNGVSDTLFAPETNLTRGMMVTLLYRLEGEPEVTAETTFTDVAADTWYTDAVAWACANEIVNGCGNGTFLPENNITREQMAAILYRYAQYKGMEAVTLQESLGGFTDADQISEYAVSAMNWAVAEGVLNGRGDGILAPTGTATRAEVAQILMNFCENVEL